jgi:RNA polymerase sigma factor (TIGR02999 family)
MRTVDHQDAARIAAFYPELRRIAAWRMRSERTPHTWQPTVLVNELYLELVKIKALDATEGVSDRDAFLGLAAHLMRRLLIHHARPLSRQAQAIELTDRLAVEASGAQELAELEHLLDRLAGIDPQLRTIVEMRVFEGCSLPQIAAQLHCAPRTVDRRWAFARKWLEEQFGGRLVS